MVNYYSGNAQIKSTMFGGAIFQVFKGNKLDANLCLKISRFKKLFN